MLPEHHVIYVPGLNDGRKGYELFTKWWSIYGVVPHVHRVGWHDGENVFEPKLKRLVTEINKYLFGGDKVSLVGGSAGGSAVLNALLEQPEIHTVVNLCGRLRAGSNVFPSLELAARKSPAFKDSVRMFERRELQMTIEQRRKVLTLSPIWDEVVPKSTVYLDGATNMTIPSVEHILSGLVGMTLLSPIVMRFIKGTSKSSN